MNTSAQITNVFRGLRLDIVAKERVPAAMREPVRDAIGALENGAAVVPHVYCKPRLAAWESRCAIKVYTSSADKDLSLQTQCNPLAGVRESHGHAVNLAFMRVPTEPAYPARSLHCAGIMSIFGNAAAGFLGTIQLTCHSGSSAAYG